MTKLHETEEVTSISHLAEKCSLEGAYQLNKEEGFKWSSRTWKRMLALAVVAFVMLHELRSYFQAGKPGSAGSLVNTSDIQVFPTHYDIFIHTNLTERTFNGYASIEMNVISSEAQHVILHAHPDLALHSLSISNGIESCMIPSSSISRDGARERFSFPIPNLFESTKGDRLILQIAWKANLSSLTTGYFFNNYIDKLTGKEGIYSVTQFEPTSARAAFPCWDEVSPKATFNLTMLSDADTINLANMDVLDECILGDCSLNEFDRHATQAIGALSTTQKLTRFRKTPLMSVYIVAFANGRFQYKEGSYQSPLTGKTVPLRVYGTSDVVEDVDCSLQVTKESISSLETLFDIAYPLPKLDSLISAKSPGAMENWGLIVGGPQSLACPSNSGLAAYQAMFLMQTHELAHQWFGNIVTMESWGQLWLNEAFATLTGEFIVPGILHPDWKTDDSFLTSHVFIALSLDGQRYSHPIEIDISDGDDVGNFDAISYSKGASVLRMLSILIGWETFLQGVSRYLKQHSYGNANTKDLWVSISETSGIDVAAIAESWTQKIGFPVLTTERSGDSLIIRQDRFLSTGDISDEENETVWSIPLGLITIQANDTARVHPQIIMRRKETIIALDDSAIYLLNSGFVGFFRVAYSPQHLELLSLEACKEGSPLRPADRAGLISDAHALSAPGYTSTKDLLSLIQTLAGCETSFVGWTAIAQALGSVRSVWWERPGHVQQALDDMIEKAFGVVIERLGFTFSDAEPLEISKLRTLAYVTAGSAGYPQVVRHAKEAFEQYFSGNHSSVHPDLRKAAFGIAVSHGGAKEHSALVALYHKLAPSALKDDVIFALTQAKRPELIQATFKLLSQAEPRDILNFFQDLPENIHARRALLNWMFDNIDSLLAKFKKSLIIAVMIKPPIRSFSSEKDRQKIEAFFSERDQSGYEQNLQQALESIQSRANWVERDGDAVEEWLRENGYLKYQ